jgi:D-alanyl-D-alanine carboxypeptidase
MSTRSRGRHFAPPAARRRRHVRPVASASSAVSRNLPLTVGLGLAVTMVTTGISMASDTSAPLISGAPQGAEPVVRAGGSGQSPDAQAPVIAAQVADDAAARDVAASRGQAASRSEVRAAPPSSGTVVAGDATLTVEKLQVDVKAAPEPPVLPGCDGKASGAGTNGGIPLSEMCVLWDGGPSIRADAAVALAELNKRYRATFGEDMCITDGYRSYSQQVATKAAKGYLAAMPGTSNHGWGLAVDLCPETYAGDRWGWLAAHAPDFGWDNPPWARPSGSKYEPWHWEFTDAVAEKS